MPELVWKRGAEDDLLSIFASLDESQPGACSGCNESRRGDHLHAEEAGGRGAEEDV